MTKYQLVGGLDSLTKGGFENMNAVLIEHLKGSINDAAKMFTTGGYALSGKRWWILKKGSGKSKMGGALKGFLMGSNDYSIGIVAVLALAVAGFSKLDGFQLKHLEMRLD